MEMQIEKNVSMSGVRIFKFDSYEIIRESFFPQDCLSFSKSSFL